MGRNSPSRQDREDLRSGLLARLACSIGQKGLGVSARVRPSPLAFGMELAERCGCVADLAFDLERCGSGKHREEPSHESATRIRADDLAGDDDSLIGHSRHGHARVEAPLREFSREGALVAVGHRTDIELGRQNDGPLPGDGVKSAHLTSVIHFVNSLEYGRLGPCVSGFPPDENTARDTPLTPNSTAWGSGPTWPRKDAGLVRVCGRVPTPLPGLRDRAALATIRG